MKFVKIFTTNSLFAFQNRRWKFLSLLLLVGIALAGFATIAFFNDRELTMQQNFLKNKDWNHFLSQQKIEVPPAQMACEVNPPSKESVKLSELVTQSILNLVKIKKLNQSFGCDQKECYFVVTDCPPTTWLDKFSLFGSMECGSRIIKYQIDDKRNMIKETITCLDVP